VGLIPATAREVAVVRPLIHLECHGFSRINFHGDVSQMHLPAPGWFKSSHQAHIFRPNVPVEPMRGAICGSLGDFVVREDQMAIPASTTLASQIHCFVARAPCLAPAARTAGTPPDPSVDMFAHPTGYRLVSEFAGAVKGQAVFVFQPIAPAGFVALGCVAVGGPSGTGTTQAVPLTEIVCVSGSLLRDLGDGALRGAVPGLAVNVLEPAFPLAVGTPAVEVYATNGVERSFCIGIAFRVCSMVSWLLLELPACPRPWEQPLHFASGLRRSDPPRRISACPFAAAFIAYCCCAFAVHNLHALV
jgi:hypothetical protein